MQFETAHKENDGEDDSLKILLSKYKFATVTTKKWGTICEENNCLKYLVYAGCFTGYIQKY